MILTETELNLAFLNEFWSKNNNPIAVIWLSILDNMVGKFFLISIKCL